MSSLRAIVLFCLGVSIPYFASATTAPKTFDNQYKAKLYGFNITVTNRLTQTADNQYHLLFKAESMIGSITEQSKMQWNPAQHTVSPLHYSYARRGVGKDRTAELSFDWNKKSVTNNVQKISWQMDIAQKVQDKLSYQIQMQQDLLNGSKSFSYQIADGGRLKEYKFIVECEEILDTPLGKVNTIKVKRSRENDERVTYAWLAKDWNYLLVRLQQEEKGDVYTIYIHKATLDGKSIEKF
ncbi:DUF3108 domain-containing protein [Cellvibrio sp. UBA7661]|uniref:DUF3108 domain-containing protein n=1 Tax=Cellvibrio sp. UBA7661 TaxID=1946311 RepID=UPI002F35F770